MDPMASPEYDLATLLGDVVARQGSDLHLVAGLPPIGRIAGALGSLPFAAVDAEGIMKLLEPHLNEGRRKAIQEECRSNFAVSLPNLGRFRFNICLAQGAPGATIRVLPAKTFPLSSLNLPPVVGTLASRRSGIILVTGPTGSGKSTTMAAMVDHVNQTGRPGKIITVEDPVEMLYKPYKCIFVQREVGQDTPSFEAGILDALRQDPDVLCIGELRDVKSMRAALVAAETGHLVLTTLHTRDASKTAQRLVSSFPADEQDAVREQLANTLEAVISQELLPKADGKGLVPAVEVLIGTSAVRSLIRENKLEAINDAILSGMQVGMMSRDSSIKALFRTRVITREVALENMRNPEILGK